MRIASANWTLGKKLMKVNSISLGDEQLFYYAMQSIRPINLS